MDRDASLSTQSAAPEPWRVPASVPAKVLKSVRTRGLMKTLVLATQRSARWVARQRFQSTVLRIGSIEGVFTEIHRRNYWGSPESVSGGGSTLEFTAGMRRDLVKLLNDFGINSVFDAPCGDFNWMPHVLAEREMAYVGADIVLPLIEAHQENHQSATVRFMHIDLTNATFPAADLMICRDCLFHLSYQDTRLVLGNFVASGIPYLLTTTHIPDGSLGNQDVITGDYRRIDLFAAPYFLPRDPAGRIADWVAPERPREMCLWTRQQIMDGLVAFDAEMAAVQSWIRSAG